jgi:hypothetical protein
MIVKHVKIAINPLHLALKTNQDGAILVLTNVYNANLVKRTI